MSGPQQDTIYPSPNPYELQIVTTFPDTATRDRLLYPPLIIRGRFPKTLTENGEVICAMPSALAFNTNQPERDALRVVRGRYRRDGSFNANLQGQNMGNFHHQGWIVNPDAPDVGGSSSANNTGLNTIYFVLPRLAFTTHVFAFNHFRIRVTVYRIGPECGFQHLGDVTTIPINVQPGDMNRAGPSRDEVEIMQLLRDAGYDDMPPF